MNERGKGEDVVRQIDENLRRVYAETADEPIPDRFEALLKKLKEQERDARR